MKCQNCRFENIQSAKFCGSCGAKLVRTCPCCALENEPGNNFCIECGHGFSAPSSTEAMSDPSRSQKVAPSSERPPDPSKGERRQATVLFCDLCGYSAMNEELDPEDVEGVMSHIKDEALRIVAGHEGTVNQFVGDEILALFGIPETHEEDPMRAVKASIEMHEMVRILSKQVEDRLGRRLRMHTGINTGLVVTNPRGGRNGLYGITGDAVNIAARLKSAAAPDEILASQHTQRLVEPFFRLEELAPIEVRGKAEAVVPYRVLGESRIRSRFEAAEKKGFTAYTGRVRELDMLGALIAKAAQGEGQFVTVAGEAGVGKSRLLYEFRHTLNRGEITVLQGRCQSYGGDTPYLPFLDALRRGLHLQEGDSQEKMLEKALANIKAIDPILEHYLPFYLHLLSIQSEYKLPDHLQGKELRREMEKALAAIITLNTRHGPMVLILEDWHWSDEASQAALKHLIEALSHYCLLLVVTYRPVFDADWGYPSYYTPIFLKPLDTVDTEKIIKSVVRADVLPAGLGRLIHDRTIGNPLFIEEICYSLLEEGSLLVRDGQAHLTKSPEQLSLPSTVHAIIRTRLDRLDSHARELIQLASVIGRVFSEGLLRRIHSTGAGLHESLQILKTLDVIQQTRVLPEAEFTFRHVLTQMVAYETLLHKRREELHGAIGIGIEEACSERIEEQYSILAYHFTRSEHKDKAVQYCLAAGDQASSLFANTEATIYYRQALDIARTLQKSLKCVNWQIDATLKLAAVGITRQDIERDKKNLAAARKLAESLDEELPLARVLYWLGRIHYVLWKPKIAVIYARQSLEIAERLNDDGLAAPAVNLMGRVYMQLSRFSQASQMMETSIEQMRRIGNRVEESTASALSGYLLSFLGEFDRAFRRAEQSIRLAEETRNPFTEANAYHLRGCIEDQQGNWEAAIKDYDAALQIAETAEDLFRIYLVKSWKGRAHSMLGDSLTGRHLLEESMVLAEKIGTEFWQAWQKTSLAACLCKLKEYEKGVSLCKEAILLGEKAEDKFVTAFAKRTQAELLSGIGPSHFLKAERQMLDAIRIQREIETRPELARSYMSFGKMLKHAGRGKKAEGFFKKALDMFQDMRMAWDAERTRRLLRC